MRERKFRSAAESWARFRSVFMSDISIYTRSNCMSRQEFKCEFARLADSHQKLRQSSRLNDHKKPGCGIAGGEGRHAAPKNPRPPSSLGLLSLRGSVAHGAPPTSRVLLD